MIDPITDLRIGVNKTRMEYYYNAAIERQKSFTAIVIVGLQSLLLANGGALAGMLTFVGNVPSAAHSNLIAAAFALFGGGLFSALIATLLSYWTNTSYYHEAVGTAESIFWKMHADMVETAKADERTAAATREGTRAEYIAIGCALFSTVAFLAGVFTGLHALT